MPWHEDHQGTALIQRRTLAWRPGHGGPRRVVVHACPTLDLPHDWEVEEQGDRFVHRAQVSWFLVGTPRGGGHDWYLVASLIANEHELQLDEPGMLLARHHAELEMHDPDALLIPGGRSSTTLRWRPTHLGAVFAGAHLSLSARSVDRLTAASASLLPLHLLVGGLAERRVTIVLRRSTSHTLHLWIPLLR